MIGSVAYRALTIDFVSGELDQRARLAAFQWLRALMDVHGEVLPRSLLAEGFTLDGMRLPLGPQGIFKPRVCDMPLSITTAPRGPYDDAWSPSGLLRYAYRGTDPTHPDNRGLRLATERQTPLVYFFGLEPGQYVASFPVFVVRDNPQTLTFEVAVDDVQQLAVTGAQPASAIAEERTEIRREYVTAVVRRRLHQQAFRARVIEAYRTHCAFCRLRHQELLDAAHITPMPRPAANRSFPTACRCASSTTPPSTGTS